MCWDGRITPQIASHTNNLLAVVKGGFYDHIPMVDGGEPGTEAAELFCQWHLSKVDPLHGILHGLR